MRINFKCDDLVTMLHMIYKYIFELEIIKCIISMDMDTFFGIKLWYLSKVI